MREIEMREIISAKCPVCGCRNKLHTEILDADGKFKGYTLKCCACGNAGPFFLDFEDNGKEDVLPRHQGKQMCIQPQRCNHKSCALYGTWPPADKRDCGNESCLCDNNCSTCNRECTHRKANYGGTLVNEVNVIPCEPPRFL